MCLVEADEPFQIKHTNRTEDVAKGEMFGFDLSKIGSDEIAPLSVRGLVMRRIGKEAFADAGWAEWEQDPPCLAGADPPLLAAAEAALRAGEPSESYSAAFARLKRLVADGADVKVYHQECGVKICLGFASMATEEQREGFARLLAESNGKASTAKPFDTKHERRMIVTEPLRPGGGFPVDALGNFAVLGAFRGCSIYQKPAPHMLVDWQPLESDAAGAILRKHGRTLPSHQIRCTLAKMDALNA